MSKFLKQIRNTEARGAETTPSEVLNAQQVLESVHGAERVSVAVADDRLQSCRKIRLMGSASVPLLMSNSASSELAKDAYRALRTRLMRLQGMQGTRSVVVTSSIPGEGKTFTSLNLAVCCAQRSELRVLLVDADLRTRGLSGLLGFPSGPGLGEMLSGQAGFEQAVCGTDLPNLYTVAAGSSPIPSPELFAGSRWKEFIGWASESFKIILIDSPPILPLADFELLSHNCDGVLLVVRANRTQRETLQKAARHVESKKMLGVVFNSNEGDGGQYYYY